MARWATGHTLAAVSNPDAECVIWRHFSPYLRKKGTCSRTRDKQFRRHWKDDTPVRPDGIRRTTRKHRRSAVLPRLQLPGPARDQRGVAIGRFRLFDVRTTHLTPCKTSARGTTHAANPPSRRRNLTLGRKPPGRTSARPPGQLTALHANPSGRLTNPYPA